MNVNTDSIILALDELNRWKGRQERLHGEIASLSSDEKAVRKQELVKVNQQIAYYDALSKDMKKEIRPSKLSYLINSLIRV